MGGPATRLHEHGPEAHWVEAAQHVHACVLAATLEGRVAAGCNALPVEAAAVGLASAAVRDGKDPAAVGHRGSGLKGVSADTIRLRQLPFSRHSEGVVARRFWVESASGLGIPLQTSCGRLRIRNAAKAAHGLVCELLHGCCVQDPAEDCAEDDGNHHSTLHAQQNQQGHEAEECDSNPGAREVLTRQGHKVHKHCRVVPDDIDAVARLQSDVGQEQADARHGGLHHPCGEDLEDIASEVKGRHDDKDHALNRYSHHHFLHGCLRPLEAHDGVGEVGVHAHAGPQAEGQVPETA